MTNQGVKRTEPYMLLWVTNTDHYIKRTFYHHLDNALDAFKANRDADCVVYMELIEMVGEDDVSICEYDKYSLTPDNP